MSKRVAIEGAYETEQEVIGAQATKKSRTESPERASSHAANDRTAESNSNHMNAFLSVADLVFKVGLFELDDLRNMMSVNENVASTIHESMAWSLYLEHEKPFGLAPPQEKIDKSDWIRPDIPSDLGSEQLKLPPRPRARGSHQPDPMTYYPHRSDVRAKGFFLAKVESWGPPYLHRFNQDTGALEDLFYPKDEEYQWPHSRTKVYIQRDLPIMCHCCGVACMSYPDLVQHCTTIDHQLNMTPLDERLPREFLDPRTERGFEGKSCFEQVKALLTYKHKVLGYLRAPMDAAGIQQMERLLGQFTRQAQQQGYATENFTLERVMRACVDLVIGDFLQEGVTLYCKDVVVGGWEAFDNFCNATGWDIFMRIVGS